LGPRRLVAFPFAMAAFVAALGAARSTELGMASVLTSADNDKTVELRVGAAATLTLPENPSTGYRWALDAADPKVVDITGQDYAQTSQAVGGGGQAQWTIKAKAPGETTVALKRWRAWEGDKSVVERYSVTLHVQP
jgi:inhibitor of cysteine peptidase